jgi:hypothetical protein
MKGRTFAIVTLSVLSLTQAGSSLGGPPLPPFEFSLSATDDTLLSGDQHGSCVAAVREELARRPLLRPAAREAEGEIQVLFIRAEETNEFPGRRLTVAVLGGGRRVNLTETGFTWRQVAHDLAPQVEHWAVENRPYIRH